MPAKHTQREKEGQRQREGDEERERERVRRGVSRCVFLCCVSGQTGTTSSGQRGNETKKRDRILFELNGGLRQEEEEEEEEERRTKKKSTSWLIH